MAKLEIVTRSCFVVVGLLAAEMDVVVAVADADADAVVVRGTVVVYVPRSSFTTLEFLSDLAKVLELSKKKNCFRH